MIEEIKAIAKKINPQVIEWRRWLHRHPELSQQEFGTMAFVAERLKEMGLNPKTGIGKTGCMAVLRGGIDPDGYCVALRSDYDALPLQEVTGLPFASENPGVMHACGHDMHTSSLLGAAKILCEIRDQIQGSIMFIFEPSEEMYPGGARMMMDDGLFDELMPNEIYSFHCLPEMDFGRVGMRKGKYMASTDELYWTVKGRGGHGATPHLSVDPILIASHIVVALQQVVSRNASPMMPTTLSFGKFIGSENVEWLDMRMTAEDFAFFAQKIPACYFRIGIHEPGTPFCNLHRPNLMVDERSIELANGLVAYNAFMALKNRIKRK